MTRTRTRPAGAAAMPTRAYAQQQTRTLLRRLAYQVGQTVRVGDADSVHDLRVAIRRFAQCLRVFGQFFPKSETKKIRHTLKEIMHAASEVRDHDIALELLHAAGFAGGSKEATAILKQREVTEKRLMTVIKNSNRANFSSKWRTKLEL